LFFTGRGSGPTPPSRFMGTFDIRIGSGSGGWRAGKNALGTGFFPGSKKTVDKRKRELPGRRGYSALGRLLFQRDAGISESLGQ